MKLFRWLNNPMCPYNCRLMYILHEPETEEKKQHYHCVISFDNPRSIDGVRKALGVRDTVWRLYHMELADVVDDLKRRGQGEFQRERKEIYQKAPVLSDPDDPQSYIEYKVTGEHSTVNTITRDFPIEEDQCYIKTALYVVPHVELVSDLTSYALYMLHATYDCVIQGKKSYSVNALQGNMQLIESCFPELKQMDDTETIARVFELCKTHRKQEVIQILLECHDVDSLKYLAGHSTFVRDWICPDIRKQSDEYEI